MREEVETYEQKKLTKWHVHPKGHTDSSETIDSLRLKDQSYFSFYSLHHTDRIQLIVGYRIR